MWSPGLAPLLRTGLSARPITVTEMKIVAGLGQVAADEDDVRGSRPASLNPAKNSTTQSSEVSLGKPQAQDRVERAAAHGGDVADVDVEALAAEEPGVLETRG